MKKNNKKKLSMFTTFGLLLAMICIVSVAGTYAKYTTTVTGTDTATIAKWAWTIGSANLASDTTTYTLDLFSTIKDTDGTTNETDVKSGKVIAPGTSGSFDIEITNNSDVNATYAVSFTETNALGAKIEYSADGGSTWGTVSELNVTATDIAMGASKTVPIKWRWVYDDNATQDAADTLVGFNAATASTVKVEAQLTVTQAD